MKRFLFLLAIFFAMAIELGAQQPIPLGLKQAIDAAVDQSGNTRIQLAAEIVRQAEAKSAQARAALLPDISASVGQQSQTRSMIAAGFRSEDLPSGLTIPSVVGPYNTFDARATATQKLIDLSSIRYYQAARVNTEATKYDSDAAKEDTAALVARTYLSAVRMQAVVETAKANVALSEALLKLANSQKNSGTGTGIEVTRAEVQLANDRQERLVAETDFEKAQLQLLRTLGFDLDARLELTDRLSYVGSPGTELEFAL